MNIFICLYLLDFHHFYYCLFSSNPLEIIYDILWNVSPMRKTLSTMSANNNPFSLFSHFFLQYYSVGLSLFSHFFLWYYYADKRNEIDNLINIISLYDWILNILWIFRKYTWNICKIFASNYQNIFSTLIKVTFRLLYEL